MLLFRIAVIFAVFVAGIFPASSQSPPSPPIVPGAVYNAQTQTGWFEQKKDYNPNASAVAIASNTSPVNSNCGASYYAEASLTLTLPQSGQVNLTCTLTVNAGNGAVNVVLGSASDVLWVNGAPGTTAAISQDTAGVFTTDGNGNWYYYATGSGSGGTPGGGTGAIQYNNLGTFAGINGVGLLLLNGSSVPSIFGGSGCSNQFIAVLSASGAPTCASVTNAYLASGTFSNVTGVGTLLAGATGAGFTVNLGASTISGILSPSNGGLGISTASSTGLPVVGSGSWSIDANASLLAGALSLGSSGTVGSVNLGNNTSGTVTVTPVAGVALGSVTANLPANTGTIAETNLAQTWSALQTFSSGITATGLGSVTCSVALVLNASNQFGTTACPSGGVTWPTSGYAVISNGTGSPSGLAPVNGDCIVANSVPAWTVGSCGGSGGGNVSASGSVNSGYVPLINGTYTLSFTGIAYGTTGNSVLLETGSGGTISPTVCPLGTASAIGCLEVGGGLSVSAGVVQLAANSGATNSFLSSINSSGVPQFTQPAFSNLSGSPSAAQLETNLDAAFAANYAPVSGDCLVGNGTPAWSVGSCASPGGTTGAIQYNNSGSFAGVVITGLQLDNGTSAPTAYGGASCSNEVITALSASGAATCSIINNSYISPGGYSNITGTGTLNEGSTGIGFTIALGASTITGTLGAANGGLGINTSSSTGIPSVSSGTWSIDSNATLSAGTLSLGASGTLGAIVMGNATSGTVTLEPVTGALGSVTASLPAHTGIIAELSLAQTWNAQQTFDNGELALAGSTSGKTQLEASAVAGSTVATFPDNTGTVAETNLAQSFSALQTLTAGLTLTNLSSVACTSGLVLNASAAVGTTDCPSELAEVQSKTGSYTLQATDLGSSFDNSGASGPVPLTLYNGGAGFRACFTVVAAYALEIEAPSGMQIYLGASESAVAGNLTSSLPGSSVCLRQENSTIITADSSTGTWNVN